MISKQSQQNFWSQFRLARVNITADESVIINLDSIAWTLSLWSVAYSEHSCSEPT